MRTDSGAAVSCPAGRRMGALLLAGDVGWVGWPSPAQHPWRLTDGDAGLPDRGVAGGASDVLVAAGAAVVVELRHRGQAEAACMSGPLLDECRVTDRETSHGFVVVAVNG